MKIKSIISAGVLTLSFLSLTMAEDSFAMTNSKMNEKKDLNLQPNLILENGQAELTQNEDLMPQRDPKYVFDSDSLIDVRKEAFIRTQRLMDSFENAEAQLAAARNDLKQTAQMEQAALERMFKQRGNRKQMAAAANLFRNSELQYGHISPEELLEDYWNEMLMVNIEKILRERFPDEILEEPEWAFNMVGGTYAKFRILFCQPGEYLGLWGVRTPQYGYSGSYSQVDFWDYLISGEITSHGVAYSPRKHFLPPAPGRPENETLSPFLRGSRKISDYASNTFMIDYARGNIASALGDGAIKPYLFETHDVRSLKAQLLSCAKSVKQKMKSSLKQCIGCTH